MRTMATLGDEHRHVSAERNRITATANGGRTSRHPSPSNDRLSMPKFVHGPTLGV